MPRFILTFAMVSAVASFVAGCGGGGSGSKMATVTGTVTYLQSIALPPDAELRVV